jgi:MYXO-CTERM domain-containing protein
MIRDLAIWGAGLIYLALVLFVNVESPVFGLALIILAGYELLRPRRRKRGRPVRS